MGIFAVWRSRALLLAAPLALMLAIACSGDSQAELQPSPTPTPTPATATTGMPTTIPTQTATLTAAPNDTAVAGTSGTEAVACRALEDITRFRFTMSIKLQIPDIESQLPDSGSEGGGSGTLDQFTQGLIALLSDLKIDGAYIKPDRSQISMKIAGEDLSVITIGDREWTKIGNLPWTESPTPPESSTAFAPSDLCDLTASELSLEGLDWTAETVNGIQTRYYHVDNASLSALAQLFGSEEDLQDLPESFTMDVWLAEDGQWPVRMSIEASDKDEQGRDIYIAMSMELTDVNSPDVTIEPPTT